MKKVVHIIIGLNVGGAELMLKRLILNNKNPMIEHQVISLTDLGVIGKTLSERGIIINTIGMVSILQLPIVFIKLKRLLATIRPDVVQTWMYHADFIGGLTAKYLGIQKIFWGIRTTDVSAGRSRTTVVLRKICAWFSYTVPSRIICAAEAGRKIHVQVGYDPKKMIVIPNGFAFDELEVNAMDAIELRQNLGVLSHELLIGSVGRFNLIKNQELFVDVAAILTQDYPDLKFVMIGKDNNYENSALRGWIEKYNLREKFLLLDQRSDIAICLKAMDVFCLHSKTEGFPNALVEAMFLKTPCVATNVGDVNIILDSKYVAVNNDKEGLKQKIAFLLNQSDEERKKIGEALSNQISSNFSIEKTLAKFDNLYEQ